jgi:hypothetical protein
VALAVLAGAAALMVRRFGDDERWRPVARPLEWLALGAGGALAVLTYVALPGHMVMIGLVEWSLLAIDVAVLAVFAVQLARISWSASATSMAKADRVSRLLAAAPVPSPALTRVPSSPAPARVPATVPASPAFPTTVPVMVAAALRKRMPSTTVTPARTAPRTPAMSATMAMPLAMVPTMKNAATGSGRSPALL